MIKTFICNTTGYKLHFYLDYGLNIAIFFNIECDYQYLKALILLISDAQKELIKRQFTTVQQTVSVSDYEQFIKDKTTWIKTDIDNTDNTNNNTVVIQCDTQSLAENMANIILM